MTNEELIAELYSLGIDKKSYKVIALLPLIQVGWADGQIQEKERKVILREATEGGLLSGRGRTILEDWLSRPPTEEYLKRGRHVFAYLARHRKGLGSEVTLEDLDSCLQLCLEVAEAAGGLFGIVGTVEESERFVLSEIADALNVEEGIPWDELMEELGDD